MKITITSFPKACKCPGTDRITSIFRAWKEGWKKFRFDSTGDENFVAQILSNVEG